MGQARLPGCSGYCSFLLIGALRAGIAFSPPEFTDGLFPRKYLYTRAHTPPLSHSRTHPIKIHVAGAASGEMRPVRGDLILSLAHMKIIQ